MSRTAVKWNHAYMRLGTIRHIARYDPKLCVCDVLYDDNGVTQALLPSIVIRKSAQYLCNDGLFWVGLPRRLILHQQTSTVARCGFTFNCRQVRHVSSAGVECATLLMSLILFRDGSSLLFQVYGLPIGRPLDGKLLLANLYRDGKL